MKHIMQYKGYFGSLELNDDDLLFYGKVEFIKTVIEYSGESAKAIRKAFQDAVDSYLHMCEVENIKPEKPFENYP